MISVLVVDDDRIARKGLVELLPWDTANMKVVGDAANGQKALEFLASETVDLVITDLEMPVMSGLELLREIREKYPEICCVVLTMHQDFMYAQESIRLGVIDYISKSELDESYFSEVLDRISKKVIDQKRKYSPQTTKSKQFLYDRIFILLSLDYKEGSLRIGERSDSTEPYNFEELSSGLWVLGIDNRNEVKLLEELKGLLGANRYYQLVICKDVFGMSENELFSRLRKYHEHDLFYDFTINNRIVEKPIEELLLKRNDTSGEFLAIFTNMLTFGWITDNDEFSNICERIKRARFSHEKINYLALEICNEANQFYQTLLNTPLTLPDAFHSWEDVRNWLSNSRDTINQATHRLHRSPEISDCIRKAVLIVQEELGSKLFAIDLAKRVNLSRSYFNQCFKEIIGVPFNDYVRSQRMKKACEYLTMTEQQIQWIAAQLGYLDEKYFSKVFCEYMGMLPSEYRSQKAGKKMSGKLGGA